MNRVLKSVLVVGGLVLSGTAASSATAATAATAAEPLERSYLIAASGTRLPANVEAQVRAAGGVVTGRIDALGLAVVTSSSPTFGATAARVAGVGAVMANPTLQWVAPAREFALDVPNPPLSGDDDPLFDLQWGHDAVDAPEAWATGARGQGVRVAVLDAGFDLDHPDLAPNINMDLSRDMTGEGLQYGPNNVNSHGTHVAGTVAAADNGVGTIGVAPEAELVLVKVLRDDGSGSFDDIIAGIVHAADTRADVINLSVGVSIRGNGDPVAGYTAKDAQQLKSAVARAVAYAHQRGATVIAGAGNAANNGDRDKALIQLPADAPHAISISATAPVGWATDPLNTDLDNLASYSNFGRSVIDFAAPGGDFVYPGDELCTVAGTTVPCWVFDMVYSTGNLGQYYWTVGTSMAAPHASGVAALIISANGGDMHPAQVEAAMRASADDLGQPGNDPAYGAGRVDAYDAVD